MEDRLLQQLKKGVLEMLVLEIICQHPTYGYELMSKLSRSVRAEGRYALPHPLPSGGRWDDHRRLVPGRRQKHPKKDVHCHGSRPS